MIPIEPGLTLPVFKHLIPGAALQAKPLPIRFREKDLSAFTPLSGLPYAGSGVCRLLLPT